MSHSFWRKGMPFITMVVASSYGMMYFQQNRYLFRNVTEIDNNQEELRKALESEGVVMRETPKSDMEFYKESLSDDMDSWQNIRGPRAYEDNTEFEDSKKRRRLEKQRLLVDKLQKELAQHHK